MRRSTVTKLTVVRLAGRLALGWVVPVAAALVLAPVMAPVAAAPSSGPRSDLRLVASTSSTTQVTTIFGSSTPRAGTAHDRQLLSLGSVVTTSRSGQVTAIRFLKAPGDTGRHTGTVYDAWGGVLTRVLFTHETASGWQRQALARPLTLAAGKQYVVAYSSPAGSYRYTYSYYSAGQVHTSGPLQAGAGVFQYGAGAPQQTFRGSNYWVDLEFRYNPATPSPSSSSPSPSPVLDCSSSAPCGFPDATSTGVPKGTPLRVVGTQTTSLGWRVDPRGWVVVDGTGAVLDGLDIPFPIEVSASNVTIKNTRVRGKGYWSIRVHDGATGVVIQDCEINGQGTSGTEGSDGIEGTATVQRCDISGVENGVTPGSGSVLRDNYIHNLGAPGAAHYDGIQMDGDLSGITIEHNTILNQFGQTSAVMIDNGFGPVSNITVNDNYLGGGGYTVYSDGQFSGGSISGVRFTNNRLVKGSFGYSSVNNNVVLDTGNVDAATGSSLHLG